MIHFVKRTKQYFLPPYAVAERQGKGEPCSSTQGRAHSPGITNRSLFRVLGAVVLAFAFLGWCLIGSAQAAIVNEPMTGATAPGWVIGGSAYLSASTGVDPAGDGWLRLTEPLGNQSGFAFFDAPFDISQGVVISFDYVTWGGNGADGYSVFLFDGSYDASTFSAGASGGSLGYAQKTVAPLDAGLTGGYIGIGIDEFGNYSNPTEGRIGGPGLQVNEVGVRGPFDHPSGNYFWLGGSGTLAQQLAFNNQLYRPLQTTAQYRKVVIKLTPVAAPTYLRVDTYVQFGFNQPLTAVVTGLSTSRPIPPSVKIGYAASTGGQNNYHEIRNLLIDPLQTDIDLAMTKTVSSPTVTAGGSLVYTLTVRNNGPANTTATNIPITDTIPALLTGATWTCAPISGGVCGAASGSGNLVTTATLSFNSGVSYTIRSTVSATAPLGSTITNTATLAPPAGITDYNSANNSASVDASVTGAPVTLSGTIYSDSGAGGGLAHNGVRDGTEGSPGLATIYAKLFRTSNMTTALQAVLYTVATGSYTFNNVPSYENYTIILSTNNNLNDPTPIGPSANWIYTLPLNYTLSNIDIAGANVTNLNFGLYNGSRISGKVIRDDGLNGAPANANDGILNAAETGIAGVTVRLANNTGATTYDTATTDGGGNFVLYTNTASAQLRIYETNPGGYLSVSFNAGTTGGAYTIGGEYIQFAYTLNTDYTGILFGDVPASTFTPTPLAQNALQNSTVYYGHTFTPGSGGTVSFSQSSRTTVPAAPAWPAVAWFNDVNCNGTYDGSDVALPASLTASAGVPICILVRDTVPGAAIFGATDQIVTRATITYTNSVGPQSGTHDVSDTTTVAAPGSVTVSGMVYNDANHNGLRDAGENSTNLAGIYAKLFRSSDLTTMLSVTTVVQSSGTYTFPIVPPNDTYTIILSSTNTATYDPSIPNTQWVATGPANYTLSGVAVGGAALANQNFGVFNGTRIDGQVLKDDGAATGANANNGVQNAGETGIAGQTVSVCDNASCVAIDTEATDANGFFSLYVPWSTALTTARITQTTMPAGYGMVNYNPGTAAGSGVNLGSRYITFAFASGTDVNGLVFSDVPDNIFLPTPQAKTGSQTAQLDYAHTFTPGSGGLVSFSTPTRTQSTWPAVVNYQDVNCNGIYDAGDVVLPASVNAVAGTPICILVRDTILASAPTGTTDLIVTRATFTFTNSSGPVARPYDVSDTTTVQTPNLSTSTKSWTDLNGGSVNAGDILQYTITVINSTATATAYGVSVMDDIPANVNSFTVVSIPALATDASTATGGTNGTGYLNVTGITVPPSSSVTIIFNVSIDGSVPAGTNIDNMAMITQPNGSIATPLAATATVIAASGNKPLYLYSGASTTMSRTPPGAQTSVTINTGVTTTWTLQPVLQGPVTITTPLTATLWIQRLSNNARIVNVRLVCSSNPAVSATGQYNGTPSAVAPGTLANVNLAGPATMSCPAGSSWLLGVNNASVAGRNVAIWMGPGSMSQVTLPSQNVITVASINAYVATYPSTTTPASGYFTGGDTVYVRAVVSDPFGSYDINANAPGTRPVITIRDSTNTIVVNAQAMTQVADSGALTKTFEYLYTPVPGTGPAGIWTASVTAQEGTEGTVSDNGIGTFRVVLMPSITAVKAVSTFSDPYNNTTNPKSIPGAVMLYTITVVNSGPGVVDTDSMALTDPLSASMTMCVSNVCSNPPVVFTCSGVPPCGLTFSYAAAVTYTNRAGGVGPYDYTPVPDAGGYDPAVTGFRVNPAGAFSGSTGPPHPQFTIQFRAKVK
jgi:uncharacterized repeat protein (TIGR01451 family)